MATAIGAQAPSTATQIDQAVHELKAGRAKLTASSLTERAALLEKCLHRLGELAPRWVDAACAAKGIAPGSAARSEEILAGPTATARQLRLLWQSYRDFSATGRIQLPGRVDQAASGGLRVPVMPVRGLFDPILFTGFQAHCWLDPSVKREDLESLGSHVVQFAPARIALVLGAGNVSSIPATDAIGKIFQEGRVVLLKMNPVNEYLGPIFSDIFASLMDAGYLRIMYGGAESGAMAIAHADVDEVHITGSIHSHDAIVWGSDGEERARRRQANDPLLKKPITSELGNVSPWIVVPGPYSDAELRFQAESIAASITNNASFNCVATKIIITSSTWKDREKFFAMLDDVLRKVPQRKAYYPGAQDRYCRFAEQASPEPADGTLPWTIVRNADPRAKKLLFEEESFVCVCADYAIDAESELDFLQRAIDFANERLWGTLSAAITIHGSLRRHQDDEAKFQSALALLRYGSIGVNHWPGLLYAMMSPPWGGYPSGTLADAQSGLGTVHNTYMLHGVQKTVLQGPLVVWPKPVWFPTHRNAEALTWKVCKLYEQPSVWKLPGIMASALAG